MGKRYYCDYCDRLFVDDIEARRKHLNGALHVRLRREHYDQFKDARTILSEECAKAPCKRFQRCGECVFGTNCRYSHYSQDDLERLRWHIAEEERLSRSSCGADAPSGQGAGAVLAAWLHQHRLRHRLRHRLSQVQTLSQTSGQEWDVPAHLQGRSDLPPSLQVTVCEGCDLETWG